MRDARRKFKRLLKSEKKISEKQINAFKKALEEFDTRGLNTDNSLLETVKTTKNKTMQQLDIDNKLKSLIFRRYTEEELNTVLTSLFGVDVKVIEPQLEECVKEELSHLDHHYLAEVNTQPPLDLEVYYLIDNGGKALITETIFNYQ